MPRLDARAPLAVVVGLAAGIASAHDAGSDAGSTLDGLAVALVAAALVAYAIGVQRLGERRVRDRLPAWRRLACVSGLAALAIALAPSVDAAADARFSAHMLQHLVLMLVAPPLIAAGRPIRVVRQAWHGSALDELARALVRSSMLRTLVLALAHPVAIYALASATFWFWHVPAAYHAALAHPSLHVVEHATLLATSLAFWSLVERGGAGARLGHGPRMLAVATFAVQNGLLGALLTFAGHPLYAAYAEHPGALEDQQLAGLLMWVPASLVHLAALAALFVGWMRAAEARAARPAAARQAMGLTPQAMGNRR